MEALECFVCESDLNPVHDAPDCIQPENGTTWICEGNYGSRAYDPMGTKKEYLQIVICDVCLLAKQRSVTRTVETNHTSISEWFASHDQ